MFLKNDWTVEEILRSYKKIKFSNTRPVRGEDFASIANNIEMVVVTLLREYTKQIEEISQELKKDCKILRKYLSKGGSKKFEEVVLPFKNEVDKKIAKRRELNEKTEAVRLFCCKYFTSPGKNEKGYSFVHFYRTSADSSDDFLKDALPILNDYRKLYETKNEAVR